MVYHEKYKELILTKDVHTKNILMLWEFVKTLTRVRLYGKKLRVTMLTWDILISCMVDQLF